MTHHFNAMKSARTAIRLSVIVACAMNLCACSHLSKEAEEIIGTYYNTELSQTDPVMELHKDAKCIIRAIKPGILTYSVDGKWNVENDSLIVTLDPESMTFEGDSTLIGRIPTRIAQKVVSYNDFSLQLETDGITYLYQRRK
ncbi:MULTISPECIES: hypothetical protein [Duncaniella]|mgnify:FL=1|nr:MULTISPECIES: hypothetical protein [Duncaniella]